MKGVIFNQLEAMVSETLGVEAWGTLLARTKLSVADGAFLGRATIPTPICSRSSRRRAR
jgi:hypothetical protein